MRQHKTQVAVPPKAAQDSHIAGRVSQILNQDRSNPLLPEGKAEAVDRPKEKQNIIHGSQQR